MLMDIREKIRGWLAYVIVGLISIPFALWGVGEYLGGGKEQPVAVVDGNEITARELDQAFSDRRQQLIAQSNRQITAEMIEQMGLKRQVLDQMINERLLVTFVREQGYVVPDQLVAATIRDISAFQTNGQFDREVYQRRLAQQGMTVDQFESDVRRDLLFNTLDNALVGSAFVTDPEVQQLVALRDQSRRLGLMRIDRDAVADAIDPADEATLRAYYEEHEADFQRPEQVRLSYVEITPETLAAEQEISEAALQSAYEDFKAREAGEAVRKARHILIQVPGDADAETIESARERLENARQAIADGEASFEDKAAELSDDASTSDRGGDLGRVEEGDISESFYQAVADLEEGAVSEPVRTRFGWHLIQVYEVGEAEVAPLEAVRDDLLADLRRDQAESAYYDAAETLASTSYEQPDSLVPAAEALSLSVETSDWISREKGKGIGQYPAVRAAAFDEAVVGERFNSELIELDNSHAVVVRVEAHRDAEARPFEAVRDEVAAQWRAETLETTLAERADALQEALAKGSDPAALAEESAAASWLAPAWYERRDAGEDMPAAALTAGFALTPPGEGEIATASTTLKGGDKAVVALMGVKAGQPAELDAETRSQLARQLQNNQANRLIEAFMRSLRAESEVEIREDALDD
ncbi:SurA N-terminal domain-containing protein [Guyparkeria hydrothermalis]|uniref:SurA N-terminal domain-containing protein n=1 Tax=Guyparkeria hydrothermalis TaxID=923 RepID=UPI002021775C|nr:SurA N-terminal domain-containing protein [Guyparkeria hydrothermalis]MCL7744320.1 SurA N-terminal domain-containing protein [Guyparkeria hydrothermalis]